MDRGKTPRANGVGGKDNLWDVLTYNRDDEAATEKANSEYGFNENSFNRNNRTESLQAIRLPPIKRRMQSQLLDEERDNFKNNEPNYDNSHTQKDAVRLPLLGRPETYINEMKEKVRELEINIIDIKAGFERKLNQLLEEIPNRLTRELKSIEERDNFQWKDTKNKIGSQERLVGTLKNSLDKTVSSLVHKVDSLQNQVESNKFKLNNMSNLVDNKLETMTMITKNQTNDRLGGSSGIEVETDVRHIKELLDSERQKRERDFEEGQKMYYTLQTKMHNQEKEILERLKEHRNYQLDMFKSGEEERSKLSDIKLEKDDGNLEYLKNYIRTVERKLEDESAFRLKNEDDLREWFEQKVSSVHQKMKNEEKMSLDREKKIMEQLQESLSTIDEIITGTKEQNMISISKSQVLLNDNMSNLADTVETVKDALTGRMDEVEKEISSNRNKLNDIQVSTYKHAQTVNDTLDKEIGRFEKIVGAFEKLLNTQVAELREDISGNDEKISKWKLSFEDLQTKKLLEIHSVLKHLNKNIAKGTKDAKERYDLSQGNNKVLQESMQDQLNDIKKKIEVDDTTLEDRVQLALTKLTERLDDDIIKSIRDYNDLVRKTKTDFTDMLDHNNDEMKKFIEQKNKDYRDKINDDRAKSDLLMEGRCQAFSIDIEKTLKERIAMLKAEHEKKHYQLKDDINKCDREIEKSNSSLYLYKKEVVKTMSDKDKTLKKWTRVELDKEVDSLNLNIFEKVEEAKIKLTTDYTNKVETEKRHRNDRIAELNSLMDSNKNLINEHIRNQIESLKSLNKALIAKEASERTKEYEKLMKILSRRIEALDSNLNNKIDEEAEKLSVRLDTYKNDFDSLKESHENRFEKDEKNILENSNKIEENHKELDNKINDVSKQTQIQMRNNLKNIKEELEIRALVNSMTEQLAAKERQEQFKKLKIHTYNSLKESYDELKDIEEAIYKRVNALEVATSMDNIVNRAAIDGLDEKYEEALQEVAGSIDKYIGIVNDTSNKQYEDFNKNLKNEFGKNLEQIQDILNNLRDEIDGQKEKVNGIEHSINEVEVNNKKDIDKVRDKIEVERLVSEMVGWIAEAKDLKQFEKLSNKTVKINMLTTEADKKAESALEGIKELEEKRIKDLEENEKLNEEKDKKAKEDSEERQKAEKEEKDKREKEEQANKEKKDKEEQERKDKEGLDEKEKREKQEKEEKDKKEKEEKEKKEAEQKKREEEEKKQKQEEEEKKRKQEEEERKKKDEGITIFLNPCRYKKFR